MKKEHLIWEDHFDSESLDQKKWNYRYGNWVVGEDGTPVIRGWGNNEQQYYTDSPANIWVSGSCLHIAARRENSPLQFEHCYPYTSARIDTKGLFSFCYGRVELRAKCPLGTGLWPAIWMMPSESVYGAWAASGEIDILETKGRLPRSVFGTIHYGGISPQKTLQEYHHQLPEDESISDFHIYELEWSPGCLSWKVDGTKYASVSKWSSFTPGITYPQPFDQPFYLLVNLAVGGWFDQEAQGDIDENALPAEFLIDYIKVYQTTS